MNRKDIDIEICDEYFADCVNWYLTKDELISKIDKLFEKIPSSYRGDAKIKLESFGQGIDATVIYTRPENDTEFIIRSNSEEEAMKRLEFEEKNLLEKLKAKYENI